MNKYISLVDTDSDSDGELTKNTAISLSSGSDDEACSGRRGKPSCPRGVSKAWSLLPTYRRGERSRKNVQYSAIVNLDTSTDSSNDSLKSGSSSALKETLPKKTTITNCKAMKEKTITETVPSIPIRKVSHGTENVEPSEGGLKHKSPKGSDSDSDDGAPIVKKPAKSRTFRRALMSQKSNSSVDNQENSTEGEYMENTSLYPWRARFCMEALRKGQLQLPSHVDPSCLEDTESETGKGSFTVKEKQRIPSFDKFEEFAEKEVNSSQKSPSREDSFEYANRSPTPPGSPVNFPIKVTPSKDVKNFMKIFKDLKKKSEYILVPDDDPVSDDDVMVVEHERVMNVKVRSRSGIQRFPLKMKETFKGIIATMAYHEGVKETQIVMFHGDRSVKTSDTPESLGLQVTNIIECSIAAEEDLNASLDPVLDDNVITVYFQGKNARSKCPIKIRKDAPLQRGLQEYCKQTGVAMETMSLQFDGDNVDCDQTADDLDIEDGDCIDAITM